MYEKNYQLKYSDIDKNGEIKITSVFEILQDISIAHSAFVGYSVKKLQGLKMAIILKGWRVKVLEKLNCDKDVTAKTGIMKIRHFETLRKYELWQDGVCKVIATASWIPIHTETLKIISTPDEIKNAYDCINEDDNALPFERIKFEGEERISSYTVLERDIDTNNHVNNVKSVEIALCFKDDVSKISQIKVSYQKAIYKNEKIDIYKTTENGNTYIEFKNSENESCVVISLEEQA